MSTTVNASRPTGQRRKLRTYEKDRLCIHEDCTTKLSKYNSSPQCHQHAPRRFPRTRGVILEATPG